MNSVAEVCTFPPQIAAFTNFVRASTRRRSSPRFNVSGSSEYRQRPSARGVNAATYWLRDEA